MYYLLILAVAAERVVELVVSKRNARLAFANGGKEFGRKHYPVLVVIHAALLLGCVIEVWALQRPFVPWLGWPTLAVAVLAQVLRWWCITTLGEKWNTLVHSAWLTAICFTLANAWLLTVRIRVENEALGYPGAR